MWWRKIWVAVLLSSCAAQPSFEQLVVTARNRWEHAVCRSPRYYSLAVVDNIRYCPGLAPFGKDWWGCYDSVSGQLQVSRKIPARDGMMLQVLTHEMGHSLHPNAHVADDAGIMSAYVSHAKTVITTADIQMICEEYDCPCRNPEAP